MVPTTRLSRILSFFSTVQRPTMLSPARWTTASKPETKSGRIGVIGFHAIWPSPTVWPRTSLTTSYPRVFKEGTSAVPTGPETPLTRIREIMAGNQSMYQLDWRHAKTVANFEEFDGFRRKKLIVGKTTLPPKVTPSA